MELLAMALILGLAIVPRILIAVLVRFAALMAVVKLVNAKTI